MHRRECPSLLMTICKVCVCTIHVYTRTCIAGNVLSFLMMTICDICVYKYTHTRALQEVSEPDDEDDDDLRERELMREMGMGPPLTKEQQRE